MPKVKNFVKLKKLCSPLQLFQTKKSLSLRERIKKININRMYRVFLTSLFCYYIAFNLEAQDNTLGIPALQLYPFNSEYINLQSFEKISLEDLPALTFKSQSIYAPRFQGLAIDRLAFKGKLFQTQSDNGVLFTDLSTKAAMLLPNREKGYERFGQNFLVEGADGMVYIKYLNAEHGYMIYKYDAQGNEVMMAQVPHSELIERPNLKYYRPFLKYFSHTKWQLVFSSYIKDKPKTVVVELSNGQVLEYDFTAQGIIRDEAEDAFIHGFVQLDATTGTIKITYRSDIIELTNAKWKGCNSVETVIKDNKLILACYDGRGSGASLVAVDLTTKALIWEAPLTLSSPVTTNSSYYNMLWLTISGNKILLEGMEPKMKYLKVFELETGKRLHQF
jgi:hypothetical protein